MRYTEQVAFYNTTPASDGYGGYTVTNALVATSWAKVTTAQGQSTNRLDALGILDPVGTIIVELRSRSDVTYTTDMYILYKSVKYVIQNEPISKDLKGRTIMITAKRA